jgi:CheY-like chemotaxis protein
MPTKRVLSVGQCYADHSALTRMLRQHFGAEVVGVDSPGEAVERLRQEVFDLVLVNRILDRDPASGLDVITQLKAEEDLQQIPVMLVSNYDDSQHQAMALGAVRGFGKAALGQPHTIARLKAFLER